MGKKLNMNIGEYGSFKVKIPKNPTRKRVEQAVIEAVVQTLNLVHESRTKDVFHPALGNKPRDDV